MEPCVFSFRLIPDLFDWSFWPLGLVYRWYEVDFLLFGVWACYWLGNRLVRTWGMGLIVNTLRVPLQEVCDTLASGRPVLDLWVTTPLGKHLWTPALWRSFYSACASGPLSFWEGSCRFARSASVRVIDHNSTVLGNNDSGRCTCYTCIIWWFLYPFEYRHSVLVLWNHTM